MLGVACIAYAKLGASWTQFTLLFLAPDLAMAGYFFGKRAGAVLYNSAHTYLAPGLLGVIAHFTGLPWLVAVSVIWIAHIGFDRCLGYGLKYETGFKDTHLNRL